MQAECCQFSGSKYVQKIVTECMTHRLTCIDALSNTLWSKASVICMLKAINNIDVHQCDEAKGVYNV